MDVERLPSEASVGFNITFTADATRSYYSNNVPETFTAHGVINFQCTYLTSIAISDSPTGSQSHSMGDATGHSLAPNFEMSTHTDWTFSGMKYPTVQMGATLFVEIKWTLNSLYDKVKFYIRDCSQSDKIGSLKITVFP